MVLGGIIYALKSVRGELHDSCMGGRALPIPNLLRCDVACSCVMDKNRCWTANKHSCFIAIFVVQNTVSVGGNNSFAIMMYGRYAAMLSAQDDEILKTLKDPESDDAFDPLTCKAPAM
jgi:hypothetical protein